MVNHHVSPLTTHWENIWNFFLPSFPSKSKKMDPRIRFFTADFWCGFLSWTKNRQFVKLIIYKWDYYLNSGFFIYIICLTCLTPTKDSESWTNVSTETKTTKPRSGRGKNRRNGGLMFGPYVDRRAQDVGGCVMGLDFVKQQVVDMSDERGTLVVEGICRGWNPT